MSASHTKARSTATKRIRSKEGEKKPRLTILPGVGLIDLDDPAVAGKLAERLAGKVGEQLVLFAQRMHEGLLAASVAIGLDVMAEFMETEVTEAAGPKGKHNADRSVYRHGHEDATVALGGRRVPVRRPTGAQHRRPGVPPRVLRDVRLGGPAHRPGSSRASRRRPCRAPARARAHRSAGPPCGILLRALRATLRRTEQHHRARPQPTGSGGRSSLPSNKSIRLARLADPLARCS